MPIYIVYHLLSERGIAKMGFAEDFILKLNGKLAVGELEVVLNELTMFVSNYDIKPKQTSITPYIGLPKAYKVYMVTKKIEGKSEETLKQYRFHLEKFFNTVHKDTSDICKEDVLLYLEYSRNKGLSCTSLNNIRRVLSAFFTWCVDNEYAAKNIVRTIPKIKGEEHIRKPLTESELEKVRDSIDHRKGNNIGNIKERDRALLEFMFSTGARVSEVANCNISDIDFNAKSVTLFGKGSKYRTSYINAKAEYYLKKYLSKRTDNNNALFVGIKAPHKRLQKGGIEKIFNQYGGTVAVHCYPHKIRHTMATQGLKHGMALTDLQKLLGHAKPETTMIYTEISDNALKYNHIKYIV